jgi:hypothetical protein
VGDLVEMVGDGLMWNISLFTTFPGEETEHHTVYEVDQPLRILCLFGRRDKLEFHRNIRFHKMPCLLMV